MGRTRVFLGHSGSFRQHASHLRGAGKPGELLLQMKRAVDAAIKFQETHGLWPEHIIANDLQIQSGVEKFYAGLQEGRHSQESIDRWTEDGTFEEMHAEHAIQCGALQMIASELIGQRTQKSAGEREFNQGIRDWIKNREMQARRQKEELKASRSAQGAKKKKGRRFGERLSTSS
jgi:hypothetical protein